MSDVWAIVLAAGKSTRMHRQKLLLPYRGKTIIEQVVSMAQKAVGKNVVVVLGSHSDEIRAQINNYEVTCCYNPDYPEGMLSSVVCGMNEIPEPARAVIIFLGDQPHIPESVPAEIINQWKAEGKGIILPVYSGKRGHPVLIETKYRSQIKNLDTEKGLRDLMDKFSDDIYEMQCQSPEIIRDIDTPSDYLDEMARQ